MSGSERGVLALSNVGSQMECCAQGQMRLQLAKNPRARDSDVYPGPATRAHGGGLSIKLCTYVFRCSSKGLAESAVASEPAPVFNDGTKLSLCLPDDNDGVVNETTEIQTALTQWGTKKPERHPCEGRCEPPALHRSVKRQRTEGLTLIRGPLKSPGVLCFSRGRCWF